MKIIKKVILNLRLYSNLKKNPSRYLPIMENKSILFHNLSKKPLIPQKEEYFVDSVHFTPKGMDELANNFNKKIK